MPRRRVANDGAVRVAENITRRVGPRGESFHVRVQMRPDPVTGKRPWKTGTYPTITEAKAARDEWQTEKRRGTLVPPSRLTVGELYELWLATKRPSLRPRTIDQYSYLGTLITEKIGGERVQEVTAATIDHMNAALRASGVSEYRVHKCHQRLVQVFAFALNRRLVTLDPMRVIEAPHVPRTPHTILTAPQIARFLTFAQNDGYSPLWLLLVQTGLRRGEALGVRWVDIDLARGRLSVRQCIEERGGKPYVTEPKTAASRRTISLSTETVTALAAHRDRQAFVRRSCTDWQDNDLVFCTPTGGAITPCNLYRNLAAILRRANATAEAENAPTIPHFRIHDLRHMHATHLLRARVPITEVAARLGHETPEITLRIYAHVIREPEDDAGSYTLPAALTLAGGG